MNRRRFLQATAYLAAIESTSRAAARGITLLHDPSDPIASSAAAQWACEELKQSLVAAGIAVQKCQRVSQVKAGNLCIAAAGPRSALGTQLLQRASAAL